MGALQANVEMLALLLICANGDCFWSSLAEGRTLCRSKVLSIALSVDCYIACWHELCHQHRSDERDARAHKHR